MICLLDTDTIIYMVRGLKVGTRGNERQRQRLLLAKRILDRCRKRQAEGDQVGLSAITVAELEYGARNSADYDTEIISVRKLLTPFTIYNFSATTCTEHYGEIRHILEVQGVPIGAMDLLIAAHARALGAILVTNNNGHFSRVPGLVSETWAT